MHFHFPVYSTLKFMISRIEGGRFPSSDQLLMFNIFHASSPGRLPSVLGWSKSAYRNDFLQTFCQRVLFHRIESLGKQGCGEVNKLDFQPEQLRPKGGSIDVQIEPKGKQQHSKNPNRSIKKAARRQAGIHVLVLDKPVGRAPFGEKSGKTPSQEEKTVPIHHPPGYPRTVNAGGTDVSTSLEPTSKQISVQPQSRKVNYSWDVY